jgi:hypothetical protein
LVQIYADPLSRSNVTFTPEDFSLHMMSDGYLPALSSGRGSLCSRGFPLLGAARKAQWFLKDGKEHPLDAVGYVAACIVFLSVVACQMFFKPT